MRRIFWDGLFKYIYDPWNRLSQVQRAYRDESNDLQATSVISTIQYDGSNRRIAKTITNSGDWNCEYHYYFDGWSRIEERDSSGQVLKQHVWGSQYIDEIVQTCLNDDPADENEDVCETTFWGLQDANFNLLSVIGSDGSFAERYEYTPYGQRTVYRETKPGNDPTLTAPILESQRWKVNSVDQPYGLCDIGHQGLFLDKEFGLYYNRARMLHPTVGCFIQRDPMGYVDGMSAYLVKKGTPTSLTDPLGMRADWFYPAKSKTPLEIRAQRIRGFLDLGYEEAAAGEAKSMYSDIANFGRAVEGLAAALLSNWLKGASQKDPYDIGGRHVKNAMLDKSGPKDGLETNACSWPTDPVNGSGAAFETFNLTATAGQYYHALGTFTIQFAGFYDCRQGECDFDGKWTLTDEYDWHAGLPAHVHGTTLQDDWALLVEKYHGAKSFSVTGIYAGVITLECACKETPASE